MQLGRTVLSRFLFEQITRDHVSRDHLISALLDVAAAIKMIAAMTSKGPLGGYSGALTSQNVQGETQKKLDVLSNDAMIACCEWRGCLAGMASEEMEAPYAIPQQFSRGPYLLVFDPLDGSSNIDVNVSVGTIFSVLHHDCDDAPVMTDYLQPGCRQVAAGYALYGPSTVLVLSVGTGTHGFTFDRDVGDFVLTHPNMTIPVDASEFAINSSNERFWEPPVRRYVNECQDGLSGVRQRAFNMRWIASMVADVHRILIRGGVFMYPRDLKDASKPGRLRLLYEASPMSFLVEQAGGMASTGRGPLLDVVPTQLHQRIPVVLGSRHEVMLIEQYHQEHDEVID